MASDRLRNQVENAFTYHPPKNEQQAETCQVLRNWGKMVAEQILEFCPESREQSLALTKVEEAVQWAIAAVVRHEPPESFPAG